MATYTTAVSVALTTHGAEDRDDHIVTFMIDDYYEDSDNKLQVFHADTMLYFQNHESRVQEFDGTVEAL